MLVIISIVKENSLRGSALYNFLFPITDLHVYAIKGSKNQVAVAVAG